MKTLIESKIISTKYDLLKINYSVVIYIVKHWSAQGYITGAEST